MQVDVDFNKELLFFRIISRLCSRPMDFFKRVTLSKFLKGIVLATLLAVFGYFGKDVLSKFTDQDTSFTHSVEKNDALDNPRMAFCFNPSIKSTAAKRYNLLPSAFESFRPFAAEAQFRMWLKI